LLGSADVLQYHTLCASSAALQICGSAKSYTYCSDNINSDYTDDNTDNVNAITAVGRIDDDQHTVKGCRQAYR